MVIKIFYILFFSLFCQSIYAEKKMATGRHFMVVSAQHLATKVGYSVLKRGGNAIDAAVAMGYALAVVHPCCGNIGGGGFMMLHLKNGENHILNFREKAPAAFRKSLVENNYELTLKERFQTVGVPGTVLGLNTALKKYGTMRLSQLVKPAIKFADRGYKLTIGDIAYLNIGVPEFKVYKETGKVFLNEGRPYKIGEVLVQKKLAKTLKLIGKEGSKAFYHGRIADQIVEASQKAGGVLSKKDLANYTVSWEKPIECNYRGYPVMTTPPPSSAGVVLCELLNVIEGFPLREQGYHSFESLKDNIETIRYVYQDKVKYFGDPDFISIPTDYLISKIHANKIRQKIKHSPLFQFRPKDKFKRESFNTTSYVVADDEGNVVAVTYTINDVFGSKMLAGEAGFLLNSELKDFSYGEKAYATLEKLGANPNSPMPNRRPVSSITQAMVFHKNRTPALVLATPGGGTIPTQLLNVIENIMDYHMPLKQAINAPRYHFRWLKHTLYLEPETLNTLQRKQLEMLGYKIHIGSELGLPYWGGVVAVQFNSGRRYLRGVMDKRRPAGMAKGY